MRGWRWERFRLRQWKYQFSSNCSSKGENSKLCYHYKSYTGIIGFYIANSGYGACETHTNKTSRYLRSRMGWVSERLQSSSGWRLNNTSSFKSSKLPQDARNLLVGCCAPSIDRECPALELRNFLPFLPPYSRCNPSIHFSDSSYWVIYRSDLLTRQPLFFTDLSIFFDLEQLFFKKVDRRDLTELYLW